MEAKFLLIERHQKTAIITINRPKQLNALNMETLVELERAVQHLQDDSTLRALVITGAGEKAFVAGADIAAMKEMKSRDAEEFCSQGQSTMNTIEGARVPVIAAVNGFALGGGAELALACDFISASSDAMFGLPEVKLGLYPGFGGTQRLTRCVGLARAKELIFTGRMILAEEALQLGLVNHVTPRAELLEGVLKLCTEIAANSPMAVRQAKRVMNEGQNHHFQEALSNEKRHFGELFKSDELKEGLTAFLEKRKPNF